MKICYVTAAFALSIAATFGGGVACAQSTGNAVGSTPAAPKSPGTSLKDYLANTLSLTASVRVRVEDSQGTNFSLTRVTPADAYVLTRVRLGLGFRPVSWLHAYAEAADARVEGYQAIPPANLNDPFDLRQAYLEVGKMEGNGIRALMGRSDFTLGSGRLVAVGDWSNDFKTLDVARVTVTNDVVKLDLIAGSPVLIDPTRFDRHKPGDHFYVAYSSFPRLIKGASLEPYFMARTQVGVKDKTNHVGDADILYAGVRLIGKISGGFDYSAEGVREMGSYANDSVDAWGYVAGAGWTYQSNSWTPRVSSDFAWASGDSGHNDGFHQGFDCMYGLNQPLNSMTGQVSWHNIADWRAGVDFAPIKKLLKIKIDYRDYWLATTTDGLYNGLGTRTVFNPNATSSHIGEGVDATVIVFLNKKTTVAAGVGVLRPGAYLTESGKHSGFVYPSISILRLL